MRGDDVRISPLIDVMVVNAASDIQVGVSTLSIAVSAAPVILAAVVFNGTFSLDFSNADNSAYLALLEDI